MRHPDARALCLLALIAAPVALAQSPTGAEARFALAVGNVWEYDRTEGAPWTDTLRVVERERWEVVRLDGGGGKRRFVLSGGPVAEPPLECVLTPSDTDRNYDYVMVVTGPCAFGDMAVPAYVGSEAAYVADEGTRICPRMGNTWEADSSGEPLCGAGGEFGVDRGYWTPEYRLDQTWAALAVTGFGITSAFHLRDSTHTQGRRVFSFDMRYLTYARIGGVEYGRSVPVAAEGRPEAGAMLRVGPNPARGAATLWAEGAGTLTVVDALGREVRRRDVRPGPVRLDLGGLPAGPYAVRLATPDGVRQARIVVVR